jgi:hypothetical protein
MYYDQSGNASGNIGVDPFEAYAASVVTKPFDQWTVEEWLAQDDIIDLPPLTDLRLKVRKNGYNPVPVLGPHIADRNRGKRPVMKGWQEKCAVADLADVAGWTREQAGCTNTGLLCGKLVGVDIDVLNEELVDVLVAKAQEIFGTLSPLRRTGKPPKTLFAYRVETTISKLQTPELFFPDGSKAKVEVLGDGNQFVAFGGHPDTGKDYTWSGPSPLDTPFNQLPVVDLEKLQAFVAEAETILRAAGAMPKNEQKEKTRTAKAQRREERKEETAAEKRARKDEKGELAGRKAAGLRVGEKADRETIESALDTITNDLDYDDWVRVGFALYDGLGDDGRELWERWSATYPNPNVADIIYKWPSFANRGGITVAYLFHLAAKNGWRRGRKTTVAGKANVAAPTIRIRGGLLDKTVDAAEEALIAAGLEVYQRGGMIVRPTLMQITASGERKVMATQIVVVRPRNMAELMTKSANFEHFVERRGDWEPIDCPLALAETYLQRDGQWRVPTLTAIINAPTLRSDGSVLDAPGYDEATGLLFMPQAGVTFPAIPNEPTKDDAVKALEFLKKPFKDFPFVSEADRSVVLSAVLTSVIRRSLYTAPAHGSSAPTPGTGKGKIVDMISMISGGRIAGTISVGHSPEEFEKRLGAALLAGDAVIALDNIEGPIGGPQLCSLLTQQIVKPRILGASKQPDLPTNVLILLNGNNLVLEADVTRRVLVSQMDAQCESPELREFDTDPVEMIQADRGAYVCAALTILRAHHVAGKPDQPKPALGSFEEWSAWVRGALVWLGEEDPCITMAAVKKADPKFAALLAVITQWERCIGFEAVTARRIVEVACQQRAINLIDPNSVNFYDHGSGRLNREFMEPEFREALLAVAGEVGKINSVRLGHWLRRNQKRLVNNRRIIASENKTDGLVSWQLEAVGGPTDEELEREGISPEF